MSDYLIYLAGPIAGLNYKESTDWRQNVIDSIDSKIECLSPLRKKQYLKNCGTLDGTFDNWPLSTQRGIYARDRFDCHRADLVLVNLYGAKIISIGTCMEIAWAAQNNTPVVLVMEDGNLHEHPMILEACPFIVNNLNEAIGLVHALLVPASHDE